MEQIYTIPVNEAFEKVQEEGFCTCPFCLMYNRSRILPGASFAYV